VEKWKTARLRRVKALPERQGSSSKTALTVERVAGALWTGLRLRSYISERNL